MAVINGAKSVEDVIRSVKAGFFSVIQVRSRALFSLSSQSLIQPILSYKVNWVVSPLSMVLAQQFIPVEVGGPCVRKRTKNSCGSSSGFPSSTLSNLLSGSVASCLHHVKV